MEFFFCYLYICIFSYYINPSTEPVYTSNSSLSNYAIALQMYPHTHQLNNLHFQFLNELKDKQRPSNRLKYSQSCRQQNDYRSITPASNEQSQLVPNSSRMTWTRKTQFRDDTTILY
jgi:hypothetical protein